MKELVICNIPNRSNEVDQEMANLYMQKLECKSFTACSQDDIPEDGENKVLLRVLGFGESLRDVSQSFIRIARASGFEKVAVSTGGVMCIASLEQNNSEALNTIMNQFSEGFAARSRNKP